MGYLVDSFEDAVYVSTGVAWLVKGSYWVGEMSVKSILRTNVMVSEGLVID